MSHFSEFDFSLRGSPFAEDKVESRVEKACRKKTLRAMGIKSLSAFSSPGMDTCKNPILTAAQIRSKGRWPKPTPRQLARAAGEPYYVGKVCKRGHEPAFRSCVNGTCMACTDLWESENRDRVRQTWRESKRRMRARARMQAISQT